MVVVYSVVEKLCLSVATLKQKCKFQRVVNLSKYQTQPEVVLKQPAQAYYEWLNAVSYMHFPNTNGTENK